MRLIRALTLLLAMTVAAGPALLDRCLISCHDDTASQAAEPSCHEHAARADGPSIHGLAACGHDHDSQPADPATDARGTRGDRHVPLATAALPVFRLDAPEWLRRSRRASNRARPSAPLHALVQLRV